MLNARCAKERFCFSPSGMRCPCVGGGAGRRWCDRQSCELFSY